MRIKSIIIAFLLLVFSTVCLAGSGAIKAVIARKNAIAGSEWLGQTSVAGASSTVTSNVFARASASFTASTNGTISLISLYTSNTSATQDLEIALYTDTGAAAPNTIIGTETIFTDIGVLSLGWHNYIVSYSVTAATKYWIAVHYSELTSTTEYYIAASGDGNARDTVAYSTWNSPFEVDTSGTGNFCFKAYNSW